MKITKSMCGTIGLCVTGCPATASLDDVARRDICTGLAQHHCPEPFRIFIAEKSVSADQIEFVELVIEHLT
jgi:hypothetical protein